MLGGSAHAEVRQQGEAVTVSDTAGTELPILVRVRVAADAGAEAPPAMPLLRVFPATQWRREGEALVNDVTPGIAGLQIKLRWQQTAEGHYEMHAEARSAAPLWLGQLTIELELPESNALVGGRDLATRPLTRSAAASQLDPKWLTLYPYSGPTSSGRGAEGGGRRGHSEAPTAWTLVVEDELDGLRALREGPRLLARLDLFSTEARPFSRFTACTDNWRAPNHRQSLPVRQMLGPEEEPLRAGLALHSGAAVPLFKARYPDGRQAALVITDHADQTASVTLRALIGGTSDTASSQWGRGGLLGAKLNITKALWATSGEPAPPPLLQHEASSAKPGKGGRAPRSIQTFRSRYGRPQVDSTGGGRPQLDDPDVVDMAERMTRQGWEIVPHSATPLRDDRERTASALEIFARFHSRTWIDHQPYTNCEALVNQGYQNGPFGIVDLLHKFGYSYAWSGLDVPAGTLNLLSPRRLDRYTPVLWPAGRLAAGTPGGLWLFSTMMMYVDSNRFFATYSKRAIDQLERERGLHIGHTYLEAFHPPTSPLRGRNLMLPGRHSGEIVLNPRLQQLFSDLAVRVDRGSLWVPTLGQLGDYFRAMSAVAVRLQPDGSATLRASQALTGATFVVPRRGLKVLIDGQPPKGLRAGRKETTFWVDLPEGREVRVTLTDASGSPVHFLRPSDGKSLLAQARR
ncbi:hypothetical protein [Haliangium sp. UPWRP_2]|uniref:hypothetical protein n=1 Tax=Haliangium sp. UPWRP_2 TaxID=1931276 RepID=UPI000B54438C|nr:hypothetical protein [Haliangium sp. UPWRP_2]PSM32062.1 hypothetical protein BVG81_002195 [Haliangium sp. UPWRP_2]